jgi:multidrug resistance efflux pump
VIAPAVPLRAPARRRESLPDLSDIPIPASWIVRRAMHWIIITILLAALGAVVAAFVVHLEVTVTASGNLEPVGRWTARARVAGVVNTVLVTSGTVVRAGQELAVLDTSDAVIEASETQARLSIRRSELAQALASAPLDRERATVAVQQADAEVAHARAQLQLRLADYSLGITIDSALTAFGRGAHTTIDAAVADLRAAMAARAAADIALKRETLNEFDLDRRRREVQLALAEAHRAADRATRVVVRAPSNGVVLGFRLETLVGTAVREGDPIIEIGDESQWRVTLLVTEQDVRRVRVGDRVHVDVAALRGVAAEPLTAVVTAVARDPASSDAGARVNSVGISGAQGYRVTAAVATNDVSWLDPEVLRTGFSVSARIVTRSERVIQLLRERLLGASTGTRM